ncbi:MAG: glycosyltransferase [Clostridiaceae bacterium]|nr:glycosyltransferase [Clostridiaceae bacterium]
MTKVTHIIADHNFGGAGQYLFNILKYRDKTKFDVEVICHGKGQLYEKLLAETDIKVHLISSTIGPKSFDMQLLKGIYAVLKRDKPDIVHVHASLAGRIAAKLLGIKVILTKHWKQNNTNKLVAGATSKILTNKIIAISNSVKTSLIENGVPGNIVEVIYNGIDVEVFMKESKKDYRQALALQDKKVVGMVARLEAEKDHDTFIRAAAQVVKKHKDTIFLIVGQGSKQPYLEACVEKEGLQKHILFTGFVSDVKEVTEAFDIAVLTSVNEAFGLVLAESMVLKKPIIATELDSIKEVVQDAGLFFKPGDHEALAKQIDYLLENKDEGERLGKRGKELVLKQFDAKKMVRELEKIYNKM